MKLDLSANPWVGDWSITGPNGVSVAQGQVTHAAAATTWRAAIFARYSTWTFNNPTVTLYLDDSAVSDDLAQYPLGPGWSRLILIDGFGTNNDATVFRDESGGAITGTSWQRITDQAPPLQDAVSLATANDGLSLEMFGPFTAAKYLEFTFEDITLRTAISQDISCLQGWSEQYRSTAPSPGPPPNAEIRYSGGTLGSMTSEGTSATVIKARPWGNNGTGLLTPCPAARRNLGSHRTELRCDAVAQQHERARRHLHAIPRPLMVRARSAFDVRR